MIRNDIRQFLLPVLFLIVVLLVWQLADYLFEIKRIILPSPLEIAEESWKKIDDLLKATLVTGFAALSGFAISICLGVTLALLFSISKIAKQSIYPYMILLQTVPIVAIAPLVIIWFGGGLSSVVVIVTVISVFPVVTNVTTGLTTVDAGLTELMHLYQASRSDLLFKLKLPNAIPYLLTGARISSGLTIVGAVVGEYMAGHDIDSRGLGYFIFMSNQNFQVEVLYASILLSTLLGIFMVGLTVLVGKTILSRWAYTLHQG